MAREVVNASASQEFADGYSAAITRALPSSFIKDYVAASRPSTKEAQTMTGMARVLTVEPDEQWRELYAEWGEEAGHEVVGVPTVPDALTQMQEGQFALVITSKQEGRWPRVHEAATEQGARTVVVSGDTLSMGWIRRSTEDIAREREVEFVSKTGEVRESLGEIFASLNAEGEAGKGEQESYTDYAGGLVDRWYPMPEDEPGEEK